MLVIADLLGVPEEDHRTFRDRAGRAATRCHASARSTMSRLAHNPLECLDDKFTALYRRPPRRARATTC